MSGIQVKRFEKQVVLITGGSSGIGLETARKFLAEGARVAILGRDQKQLNKARDDLQKTSSEIITIEADVSQFAQMRDVVNQVVQTWDQLDILFANAGVNGVWAPIDELQPEEWEETVSINLNGTYYAIHAAIPHLKRSRGSIVITSSVNGTRMFSNSGATAYACTKAAQVAMAKMLALELSKDHVRVNVICPGYIETAIEDSTEKRHLERAAQPVEFPAGTVPLKDGEGGQPEEVADLVLFLSSQAARHISGTEVWIDGAQSLLQG